MKRWTLVQILRWLIGSAIVKFFDLSQFVRGLWQVHIRHLHEVALRDKSGNLPPPDGSRVAIVAIYPSDASLPFTLNLLRSLVGTGFYVVVISTRSLTESVTTKLADHCHHMIERLNVGQDFGSYQMGLRWLESNAAWLGVANVLILANDSLFYPRAFQAEVERMVADPYDWQALFENYEKHYHAGSFFLLFRRNIFTSPVFQRFWSSYHPYPSRVHAIDRGEVRLSTVLRKAGFICNPAYSSSRLVAALLDKGLELSRIAELSPADRWDIARPQLFVAAAGLAETSAVREAGPEWEEQRVEKHPVELQTSNVLRAMLLAVRDAERTKWIYQIGRRFELSNPAHTAALLINALFTAPIKRDVCYRGAFDIFQIPHMAIGFDTDELTAMEQDLTRRGLPVSMGGLRRLLYQRGRI